MGNSYAGEGKDKFTDDWDRVENGEVVDYQSGPEMRRLLDLFQDDIPQDAVVLDIGCGPSPLSTHLVGKDGKVVHRVLVDYVDKVYKLQVTEPDAPVAAVVDLNVLAYPTTNETDYAKYWAQFTNGIKYANKQRDPDATGDDLNKADVCILGSILNYIPSYQLIPFLDKYLRKGARIFMVNTMFGYKSESWLKGWGDSASRGSIVRKLRSLGYKFEYPSEQDLEDSNSANFELVAVKN